MRAFTKTLAMVAALLAVSACAEGPTAPPPSAGYVVAPLGYHATMVTQTPEFQAMLAMDETTDPAVIQAAARRLHAVMPDLDRDEPWCDYEDDDDEGIVLARQEIDVDPCSGDESIAFWTTVATIGTVYACGWPGWHCLFVPVTIWAYVETTTNLQHCMCNEGVFSDLSGDVDIVPQDYGPDTIFSYDIQTVEEYCGAVPGWEPGEHPGEEPDQGFY